MRTLPLDGLLQSLSRNYNHRNESARLFELAFTYHGDPQEGLPSQSSLLTFVAYDTSGMDFFDIKGDAEQVLLSLGVSRYTFKRGTLEFSHPGRSADIACGETSIGFVCELHPQVCANYDIGTRAYAAVLVMDTLHPLAAEYKPAFVPLPKFPSVQRDLAFTVKTDVTAAEIDTAIREWAGPLLVEVKLFDVYQGAQIEQGFKSMGYNLKFRAPDRTLTDEDVQKPLSKILRRLKEKCGAELRE
jgi:phenylalanyl-tRNA synthetase beta chain